MSEGFSQEDRELLQNLRIEQEVFGRQLREIRMILFGDRADGILYQFQSMKRDIDSIPLIKAKVDEVANVVDTISNQTKNLTARLDESEKKLASHSRILLAQKIRNGLIIFLGSAATTFLTLIAAFWSGIVELFKHSPGPGH